MGWPLIMCCTTVEGAVARALTSCAMLAQCGREMRAIQQRAAEQDKEDAADFIAKVEQRGSSVQTPKNN